MAIVYRNTASVVALNPSTVASYQSVLFALMLRNVTSDGWVLSDPFGDLSQPGAIIASPSYPANDPETNQNYVYNWTRDAAITAFEVGAAPAPWTALAAFGDYVSFAQTCQAASLASGLSIARACYQVNGTPRNWSDQNDGPALQTLAILDLWPNLPPAAQATGRDLIQANVTYLLGCYQAATTNLWEEAFGLSFFAQSVILQCFNEALVQNTPYALGLNTALLNAAVAVLNDPTTGFSAAFWDASNESYTSIMNCTTTYSGSGLNADLVMASVYGAIPCTDPKLLSSAAQILAFFKNAYPINASDAAGPGVGPMIGRYPGDTYDGDTADANSGPDHPWAPCTANFAELYYNLGYAIKTSPGPNVGVDPLAVNFFAQVGITAATPVGTAASLLQTAGDEMLQALIYHSDFLELSEQFDGTSGYEKSVRNLTWSYAAFLSALRARSKLA
jgi:glucoamylase